MTTTTFLPNGVDPRGAIHPICLSANFRGNRGILHGDDGHIVKQWAHKSWVTCSLHFPARDQKPLMQPGRYSELFFLDEATALAAGHRPCAECQKEDYQRFKTAWGDAHGSGGVAVSIADIDQTMHTDRLTVANEKRTFDSLLRELPFGAMFEVGGKTYLQPESGPLRWTPTGYRISTTKFTELTSVKVLTPSSIVGLLRAGYVPHVHDSWNRPSLNTSDYGCRCGPALSNEGTLQMV
jgi:hypothetical protein